MRAWKGELGSSLKGVLPKWHGSFQVRLTPSVIPSEVEESLILTITSSKRCLDCARHDKKPIWATRPLKTRPRLLLSLDGFAVSAVGQTRRGEADNSRACAKSEDRPRSLPFSVEVPETVAKFGP